MFPIQIQLSWLECSMFIWWGQAYGGLYHLKTLYIDSLLFSEYFLSKLQFDGIDFIMLCDEMSEAIAWLQTRLHKVNWIEWIDLWC